MNTKILGIIIVVALVIAGFVLMRGGSSESKMVEEHSDSLEAYEMSPSQAVNRMQSKDGVVVLDVRTIQEYEEIHLQNALLLPVQELSQASLNEIGLSDKDQEIILYCRSGARSKTAFDIMNSLGYTNIKSVAGGMIHWQEDNYPLTEVGTFNESKNVQESDKNTVGPKISIGRKLHDFGEIPQFGGVRQTLFTVTNTGAGTLVVGDITTSCSCTSATLSSYSIEAGESAELTVLFDPDLHEEPEGVFTRTVFIPSNDVNIPEAEVAVQVDILEGV
jgi:rhodanese-related sulfurtransferase